VWTLVNFFIAGYPKCGTTALYQYLKGHPRVYLPELKEPHFFTVDFPGARRVSSIGEYERLYADAPRSAVKGDASASVIHSLAAVDRILEYAPQARFVVLVREPVAAVRSFHGELLYNLTEDQPDFEQAWHLQSMRAGGKSIPDTCREPAFLQYATIFRYRDQLPRFVSSVPPERRLIMVYEEFFADPRAGYVRLLEFLGLEDDGRGDFGAVNAAKQLRSRRLASLHKRIVERNGAVYRAGKWVLSGLGVHPSNLLARINLKKAIKADVAATLNDELRRYFRPDVEAVERILGRTVKAWEH
jgi:hypothetical protein